MLLAALGVRGSERMQSLRDRDGPFLVENPG